MGEGKGEEKGVVKRPVTYLDDDDFKEIERFRKRRGFEKSWAITTLIRVGVLLSRHDPELYEELEKKLNR